MVSFWTVHGMLEVMDVVDTGRRRFSIAEKIRIVEESQSGPNMVRSTARRYGVAVSGLYRWRRQYQRGELGGSAPSFHAVEFFPAASALETPVPCGASPLLTCPPGRPSFIPRVWLFDSRGFRVGQARRARCRQIAQGPGALVPGFCSQARNAA